MNMLINGQLNCINELAHPNQPEITLDEWYQIKNSSEARRGVAEDRRCNVVVDGKL
jgi:hypothetical protein